MAVVEDDEDNGALMLQLDLAAMAPRLYVPMSDIAVAKEDLTDEQELPPLCHRGPRVRRAGGAHGADRCWRDP